MRLKFNYILCCGLLWLAEYLLCLLSEIRMLLVAHDISEDSICLAKLV